MRENKLKNSGKSRCTFSGETFAKIDGIARNRSLVLSKTDKHVLGANSRSMPTDDTRSICAGTRIDG